MCRKNKKYIPPKLELADIIKSFGPAFEAAGPDSVIEYLGRYTHNTAISNHRLLDVGNDKVTFHYKDYREKGTRKTMALDGVEFLRRFCVYFGGLATVSQDQPKMPSANPYSPGPTTGRICWPKTPPSPAPSQR